MCGIVAIVDAGGPAVAVGERMCEAMRHRGPDDLGIRVLGGRCLLGNLRLSILDPGPSGHMPMGTDDGRFWLTYNGEVYNFAELRGELLQRGHRFRSRTDSEVVLHLFQEYGEACVGRMNGMFALAIWDNREGSLFLARDRFGIKPLYYTQVGQAFLVASEIRGLLASGLLPRVADRAAIEGYLMLGSVPDDRTIIAGVRALAPAHYATFRDGTLTTTRYWSHTDHLLSSPVLPAREVEEAIRAGLKDTVRRQIVSDVPLGAFLSSGVDSTTLVAAARASGCEQIKTVSVSLPDRKYSEGEDAGAVAARFGTDHVDFRVAPNDVLAELDDIVRAMDQPSIDAVNTYVVSKAARQAGLKVALSGLGADELFGGYRTFTVVPRLRRALDVVTRLPAHGAVASRVAQLSGLPHQATKAASWLDGQRSLSSAYVTMRGLLSPREVQRFLSSGLSFDAFDYAERVASLRGLDETSGVSVLESRLYMHNQLLRDTDAMSMAHSLEVRVPYLDDRMVSLAAQCRFLLGKGSKVALEAARSIYFPLGLPVGRKRTFAFPFDSWLRGPLREQAIALANSPDAVVNTAAQNLLADFYAGRRDWAPVWAFIVLHRWLAVHRVSVST